MFSLVSLSLLVVWGKFTTTAFVPPAVLISKQQLSNYNGAWTTTTTTTQNNMLASRIATSSSRGSPLFMGWGPDPIWTSAKVTANKAACVSETCVSVTVELDKPDVAKEYTIPGQYVQIRLDEETKPLFLAIASPPANDEDKENASPNPTFEFLIKKTPDNAWMTDASVGTVMDISQVLGKGFPIQQELNDEFKYDFPTQSVLLFAAGSGIAPICAALESGQLSTSINGEVEEDDDDKMTRLARLYYGVRTPDDLCFTDKFAQWEQEGVQVVPVVSQPDDKWTGRTGYIQTALEEDGIVTPRNSGALLCGMKGMVEAVKDVLTKAGVFEGRQLTNF